MAIERQPITDSRAIKSIGYSPDTQTMHVEFMPGGKVHEYTGVTEAEHAALMNAQSKGKHFHEHWTKKGRKGRKI